MNFKMKWLTLLSLMTCYVTVASAQSLKGKKIFVSSSQRLLIKFPSVISNVDFGNNEVRAMFEYPITNDKNLSINSVVQNFTPKSVVITEGKNTHVLILEYKEILDPATERLYDYSTKAKLAKEVQTMAKIAKAQDTPADPPTPPVVQTTPPQETPVTTPKTKQPTTTGGQSVPGNVINPNLTTDKYLDIITKANKAFSAKSYVEAKDLYQQALAVKPDDSWSLHQISTIDNREKNIKKEDEQKASELAYQQYFKAGQDAITRKEYDTARNLLNLALKEKPNDKPALSQLLKIDKLVKEETYSTYMNIGKEALANQLYDDAEMAFKQAVNIKPNDPMALAELRKIKTARSATVKKALEDKSKADKETRFRDSLVLADNLFEAGMYADAKKRYKSLYRTRPTDMHISRRLLTIDSIESKEKTIMNAAKKDSLNTIAYNKEIEKGNKALDAKDLKKAKAAFQLAQSMKPGEKLPAAKLSTIEVMLSEAEGKKQAELQKQAEAESNARKYSFAIKQGQAALKKKEYEVARDYFIQALSFKPGDKTASTQLEVINKKIQEIEDNRNYEKYVHMGDSTAWKAKEFLDALKLYDSALAIKPLAKYPRKQIVAVNTHLMKRDSALMAQEGEKARTGKFNQAMIAYRSADTARLEKKYEHAYIGYHQFLQSIDTVDMNKHLSTQLHHINLAKDWLKRLDEFKPKPKPLAVQPDPKERNKKAKKKKRS